MIEVGPQSGDSFARIVQVVEGDLESKDAKDAYECL